MKIGIAGGGIGGMATAIALQKQGHDVTIFERARAFGRIGADVNLTPNAVHALDGLGIGDLLRKTAARPEYRISRTWDTGEETSRLPMSTAAEERYGAPQLTIHRADLLAALENALAPDTIRFAAQVQSAEETETGATALLADGTRFDCDVLIGADGIHSAVRHSLFGEDHPRFTGLVSYRAVFPRERGEGIPNLDSFTKWWGPKPDRQIVTFPLNRGTEIFVFATTPQDDWTEEGWTLPGDIQALRDAYADFHPEARALLDACETVTRSALHVREPMQHWSRGAITLLGDAAHPMVPFMAQGACMASEDAVVLARALDGATPASVSGALKRYEEARIPRTAKVQQGSLANDWLKQGTNADWVYGYDAWAVELASG
ncbi:FAD-dependent monooxygenase [Nitratireductor kimnyeongensis]|uniref:FAD-dependent monooxygenase n=1 Tax=Nitratireductor kimnyeongensis TaxID=430679 RepID=A0ABW0T4D8_9HYPH|nr:FAD-dependent monooxygenase [Nitratireductor kimnyeongensis]QZZ34743.1 FAD-dependent monooxygenase [Nitratireductor kimnyeongensis]